MSVVVSRIKAFDNLHVARFKMSDRDQRLLNMVGTHILHINDLEEQMNDKSFRTKFPKFCDVVNGVVDAFRSLEDATSRELIDIVFASVLVNNNVTQNNIRVGFDARVANIVTRTLLDLTGLSDTSLFPVALNGCAGDAEAFQRLAPDFKEEDIKLVDFCDRLFQLYLIMPNIVLFVVIFLDKGNSDKISLQDKIVLEIVKRRVTNIDKQLANKKRKFATVPASSNKRSKSA